MQVQDLNDQAAKIAELRIKEAELHKVKQAASAELEGAEKRMIDMMVEASLKTLKTPSGTVSVTTRQSVRLPQTEEEKQALYAYLHSKGKLDLVVKPNSQSLNSLWKEEFEEAISRGDTDYEMPGVTGVTINLNLSFRKA